MTLQRHVMRIFGSRILAALLVLIAILQILDLLDVTTDILDRKLGMAGVLYYAALRTPSLIVQVAPLAVLAGSLFAFAQLAQENAVTAMRATGMSAYRLTMIAAPVALTVLLLHLAAGLWLAPRSEQALQAWWARTTPTAERKPVEPRSFRVGSDVVVATLADPGGGRLSKVTIYRRDAGGRLVQTTRADAAVYEAGRWRLEHPTYEMVAATGVQQGAADQMTWTPELKPRDVVALFSDQQTLSAGSARRALEGGASARPAPVYQMQLQRGWAAPLGALVMLLLAAPVALVNFRSGGAQTLSACLGAGLLFMVVDGVFTALGESAAAPPVLAAWAAPLIFAAGGITALLYMEG